LAVIRAPRALYGDETGYPGMIYPWFGTLARGFGTLARGLARRPAVWHAGPWFGTLARGLARWNVT